jgi:hypothetical protein
LPPVGELGGDDLGVGRQMYEKVDDVTCEQFTVSRRGCGEFLERPRQL